jgi:hypothetical protein
VATPRKRWPNHALWALEDVTAILLDIQALARQTQIAVQDNSRLEATIIAGDIRDKAARGVAILSTARNGACNTYTTPTRG